MSDDNQLMIDDDRTACLCDVGAADYLAAVVVDSDGTPHMVLAECASIGHPDVRCDTTCGSAVHEQLGPLPIEYVRRITISRRTQRCGRPTKTTGRPCRIEVTRIGEPCGLHREQPALDLLAEQLGAKPVNEGEQPR
ncbi:MAG: hypothetical protein QOC62_3700 [Mycobacterium sp.]|nr:hypothetical protein [Mycobacterium sp.]